MDMGPLFNEDKVLQKLINQDGIKIWICQTLTSQFNALNDAISLNFPISLKSIILEGRVINKIWVSSN